jgi:hypothetical protein
MKHAGHLSSVAQATRKEHGIRSRSRLANGRRGTDSDEDRSGLSIGV